MQSRQKLILGLAMVLALVAGLMSYQFLSGQNKQGALVAQKTVYVAAHDLQARAPITPDMLESVSRPATAVDQDAVTSLDQIKGKIALTTIPTGATITASRIGAAESAPLTARMRPGIRAVTIGIDSVRGVANLIQPGDRVDVMAVQHNNGFQGSGDSTKVSTIISGAVVLAMGKQIEHSSPTKDNNDQGDATTVTLGLSPKIAEELALADATSSLRLTLRPAKEGTALSVSPYTLPKAADPPATSAPAPAPVTQQNNAPVAAAAPAPAAPKHPGLAITVIDGDHVVGDH
jgi:pilus assembly protein CpaB